jgi:uncharacterized protein (DUF3084 family)
MPHNERGETAKPAGTCDPADPPSLLFFNHIKETPMQTATLIFSILGFGVSCATLTIVLVGGREMKTEVEGIKAVAEDKRQQLKAAIEGLL